MSKLALVNRVPRQYDAASIQEIVRLIEQQGNKLAEGSIAARHGAMTAAPTAGSWVRGDIVDNSTPSETSNTVTGESYVIAGWICTASGTPGTWKELRGLTATAIANQTANRVYAGPASGAAAAPSFRALVPADLSMTPIMNVLGADVALNNTANYFDGPSIAQGTIGTWFVSGTVTVYDSAGPATFKAKLWDGTTVIASADQTSGGATIMSISLSGYLATPAGNLRISVKDASSTNGKIQFNDSGTSKDSTITAIRIG